LRKNKCTNYSVIVLILAGNKVNGLMKKSKGRAVLMVFVSGFIVMLTQSCGTARRTTQPEVALERSDYISKYSELAREEMRRTGVPASITMAQALLESDNGNSYLARAGNNHFGIKCHRDWDGKKIYYDDDKRHECFRRYGSVEQSFRDHSDFLVNGSRYAFLFELDSARGRPLDRIEAVLNRDRKTA